MDQRKISYTPFVGIRFDFSSARAYYETGGGIYNLILEKTAPNNIKVLPGFKIGTSSMFNNHYLISYSLIISLEYNLLKDKNNVKTKLTWMDSYLLSDYNNKYERLRGNVGGSVTLSNHIMLVGVNCKFLEFMYKINFIADNQFWIMIVNQYAKHFK